MNTPRILEPHNIYTNACGFKRVLLKQNFFFNSNQ